MYTPVGLSVVTLMGLAAVSLPATAANYTVDCGTGGSATLVQNQLNAITGKNNTLTVTGTCTGELTVTGIDSLSIVGLSLTGDLTVTAATHIGFSGLAVNGSIQASDHAFLTASSTTLSGYIQAIRNSSVYFDGLTLTQPNAPNNGAAGSAVLCLQGSDCHFGSSNISGTPSGDPLTPAIGVQVASTARLNFASGRISGFDWGVHVWNNATAFFNPDCDSLSIDSNKSIGVYVRDGGIVKLEGAPPPIQASCWAIVLIANNGNYGLLAEGGGQGFLYRAQVMGHVIDGVRVQDGSVVKVHSSAIDAATGSGRSAWVKSHSHLWFDEEVYGPGASSSLAGPVCVTNNSSVDTDNSATQFTTVNTCATP